MRANKAYVRAPRDDKVYAPPRGAVKYGVHDFIWALWIKVCCHTHVQARHDKVELANTLEEAIVAGYGAPRRARPFNPYGKAYRLPMASGLAHHSM